MNSLRLVLSLLVLGGLWVFGSADVAKSASAHCPASGVDQLLRRCSQQYPDMVLPLPTTSCEQHERGLAALDINGRTPSWDDYASWGEQLFNLGFADHPPAGPFDPHNQARSLRISDYTDYTCSRCHNDKREDPVLTNQDPEARFELIQSLAPADYRTSPLKMVQGVTMWGGVNRMRFYNGLFSYFDPICLPAETTLYRSPKDPEGRHYQPVDCGASRFTPCQEGCRKMNTASFKDAIQTCGRYCGVGRFLEDWELHALLTHFWEGQVRLEDVVDSLQNQLVAFEPREATHAKDVAIVNWKLSVLRPWLQKLDATPTAPACQALSDSYLLSSCETLRDASAGKRDDATCWRDWTSPPPRAAEAASLPAMIRHIYSRGPTLKMRPARPTDTPAFVEDDVPPAEEPPTEALRRGKALYDLSCGQCHGQSVDGKPQLGGRGHGFLAGSKYVFFRMIEHGLNSADPTPPRPLDPTQEALYMPEFTLQRLSYQQAEDIYNYLSYLNGASQ